MDTCSQFHRVVIVEREVSALWNNLSCALSRIESLEKRLDEIQSALEQREEGDK